MLWLPVRAEAWAPRLPWLWRRRAPMWDAMGAVLTRERLARQFPQADPRPFTFPGIWPTRRHAPDFLKKTSRRLAPRTLWITTPGQFIAQQPPKTPVTLG